MRHVLDDLVMTLNAVKSARASYVQFVNQKFAEACKIEKPQTLEQKQAIYKRVTSSFEAFHEYQKLVTLYGCLGAQSDEYLTALNFLTEKAA
jgi:hypothetical protein